MKSPTPILKETIVTNAFEKKEVNSIEQTLKLKSVEENKLFDEVSDKEEIDSKLRETLKALSYPDKISNCDGVKLPRNVLSSLKSTNTEKVAEIYPKEVDVTKVQSLHIYPDLKCLQYCEQMHNLVSSQTLVKTYTEEYKHRIAIEANKGYQEFIKVFFFCSGFSNLSLYSSFNNKNV